MKRRPSKRWVIVTAAALALEAEALKHSKHDATFSQATRQVFRTETKYGKIAFIVVWTWLYFWFLDHIMKGCNK